MINTHVSIDYNQGNPSMTHLAIVPPYILYSPGFIVGLADTVYSRSTLVTHTVGARTKWGEIKKEEKYFDSEQDGESVLFGCRVLVPAGEWHLIHQVSDRRETCLVCGLCDLERIPVCICSTTSTWMTSLKLRECGYTCTIHLLRSSTMFSFSGALSVQSNSRVALH